MNLYRATLAAAEQRFQSDITEHQLRVHLDHGVHRHLVCRRPGTGMYWFTITTWPGHLAISGDMGDYVFRREADMFPWFGAGEINPDYWSQKLTAVDKNSPAKEYSEKAFRQYVAEHFWERREQYTPAQAKELWTLIKRDVLKLGSYIEDVTTYDGAYDALREFEAFDFPEYEYEDYWEANWDEYTIHYLWCCHAIVWAIREYRKQKQGRSPRSAGW